MNNEEAVKRIAAIWVKGHGLNLNDFIDDMFDIQDAIVEEVNNLNKEKKCKN